MFLKRVKVDDFRVLKNVDLTFEPDFVPSTFPLGSLNGGGKSTLLQLIFTLLHCSFDEAKHQYLVNLLSPVVQDKPDYFSLALFELLHDGKEFFLEFLLVTSNYRNLNLDYLSDNTISLKQHRDSLCSLSKQLKKSNSFFIREELQNEFNKQLDSLKEYNLLTRLETADFRDFLITNQKTNDYLSIIAKILECLDKNTPALKELNKSLEDVPKEKERILMGLQSQDLIYITHINSKKVLLCKTSEHIDFLWDISFKVYLAAPSTQVFLFLSTLAKQALFSATTSYNEHVNKAKNELLGLFTYDFAPVKTIIEAFVKARDKDFNEALDGGGYGNNLQNLRTDLDSFFFGKSITVNKELNKVIFKLKETGEELSPEDLSHGELKKLGIYVWLKYQGIENALVLMDEIEIGLHPDWQYEIANELQNWSHGNQFILATHSYELCQALTPSHVKELSPKLIK